MSAVQTLPRVNFQPVNPLEDARVVLAKEASAKLGYNRLALAIAAPDALLYKLRELGIQPFVDAKVQQYKDSKVRVGMYSGTRLVLLSVVGFVVALCAWTESQTSHLGQPWSAAHYVFNAFSVTATTFFAVTLLTVLVTGQWEHGDRRTTSWKTAYLRLYGGNVPEFALVRALTIKQELPAAEFLVEQLYTETQHRAVPEPDPFLVVVLGNERYYIDVWDEKEYEAQL
jgi:hypothetical protein